MWALTIGCPLPAQVWSVITMLGLFGCFSPSVTEQAKLLRTKPFSQQSWAAGTQEQRGEMVYSFLSQHDTQSLSAGTVKQILGEPTGYYDYDENPAYVVGSSSVESEYGKGYLLAFVADKESREIKSIIIIPEPKSN